jgi:hypothetical protein
MPIEIGLWKLGPKLEAVRFEPIEAEKKLEDALVSDLSLVSDGLLLIGRQISTNTGKIVDLLAIDADGRLLVIELKRDKSPRDAVAQLLSYGAWAGALSRQDISDLYARHHNGNSLDEGFTQRFGASIPEEINEDHQLFLVCTTLDSDSERVLQYLSGNYGVPINAVFFRFFRDGKNEFLARSWLIEPNEAEARSSQAITQRSAEPWNGRDFVVNIGDGRHRAWEDCCKYGFVSGGQGRWYSNSLHQLFPGARIFAFLPGQGFVGVGYVRTSAVPVREFVAKDEKGVEKPLLQLPLKAAAMSENSDDPDKSEYVVGVEWKETQPREKAYRETGMQGNQNTAWRLRNRFTLEKLKQHFRLED